MLQRALLLTVPFLVSTLQAQTITVTASAIAPITPAAGVPPLTATQLQPAGTLPSSGFLDPEVTSGSQSSTAELFWAAAYDSSQASFSLGATLNVKALGQSHANSNLCDVVVTFQASSPVTVDLSTRSPRQLANGYSIVQDRVDVNGDGTFEILEGGTPNAWLGTYTIGAQPLQVRFRLAFSQTGPGTTTITRVLELTPKNDLAINTVFPGCGPELVFAVEPTFVDTGIRLTAASWSPYAIGVLGLGFQPVALSATAGNPCVLIPSVDLLVLLPSQQRVHVALPPAVRPVAFWVQAVELGLSLDTSHAFSVLAF